MPTGRSVVGDHAEHRLGRLGRGRDLDLAGRGLDEVGAVLDREPRRTLDRGNVGERAGLEDHLHARRGRRAPDTVDHVRGTPFVAGQPCPVGQHDVDLVGPVVERAFGEHAHGVRTIVAGREVHDGRDQHRRAD